MDTSVLALPSSSSVHLARMDEIMVGFSGESSTTASPSLRRRPTYRSLSFPAPPDFFYEDDSDDEPHHFLDSCFLCKIPLDRSLDIFMYRGDTPFCTDACREEQIEIDLANEKNWKISMKKNQNQQHQKHQKHQKQEKQQKKAYHVRASTLVTG